MTVPTYRSREDYTGNGVTTSYPYQFRIYKNTDLVVTRATPAGIETTLVLNTDYTVTGVGKYNGGNVVLASALASGYRLAIERALPVTQETDLRNQGAYFAETHEDVFDRLAMLLQRVGSYLGLGPDGAIRTLLLGKTDIDGQGAYRARGNRISDLGDPVNMKDAANKQWTLTQIAASMFTGVGNALLQLLASNDPDKGAAMVGVSGGGTQSDLNAAQANTNAALATITGYNKRVYLLGIIGQSNARGANNGGPNPANPLVKVWDGATGTWGSSNYTQNPFARTDNNGNGGNNNIGLALAHKIADMTGALVLVVYDAVSGRPIEDWQGAGTSSVRYAAFKAKVEAALATPQLAGVTKLDYLIYAQGEENGTSDSTPEYFTKLAALDAQFRAESWMSSTTPMLIAGMSGLHDRYLVWRAQMNYCENVNRNCIYVNSKGLKTQYDVDGTGDYTHWLGQSLWDMGYSRMWNALQEHGNTHRQHLPPFQSRSAGVWEGQTDAIAMFDNLIGFGCRTDGVGVSDTFTGDGSATTFTLTSNGTVTTVFVGTSTAAYTVSGATITFNTAPTAGQAILIYYGTSTAALSYTGDGATTKFRLNSAATITAVYLGSNPAYTTGTLSITFTGGAPANGSFIFVGYAASIGGPSAQGSISWGYRSYADGNYTYALGYRNLTDNACNYTMVGGRDSSASSGASYSLSWGFQNSITNTYQFAAGRGITLADTGTAAVGLFPKYTTTQTDPAAFQVGVGTTTSNRANALTVRKSGVTEHPAVTVANLPAAATGYQRAFVTDANATTFASVVAGGGANKVPVYSDGTNWRIG